MNGLEGLRGICQLLAMQEAMDAFTEPLGCADRLYLVRLQFIERLQRRWNRFLGRPPSQAINHRPHYTSDSGLRGLRGEGREIQEGDLVEIRPMEEIRASLLNGKTRGLDFMSGMEKYCGKRVRVFKRVRYIFDERGWKMRKCNSLLLEDVICDGRGMYDKDGCDRCCFYFWKDEWVRKI